MSKRMNVRMHTTKKEIDGIFGGIYLENLKTARGGDWAVVVDGHRHFPCITRNQSIRIKRAMEAFKGAVRQIVNE